MQYFLLVLIWPVYVGELFARVDLPPYSSDVLMSSETKMTDKSASVRYGSS